MLPNVGLTKAMVEAEQMCITDNDFVLRVLNHALKHVSALKQSS